MLFVTAIRLNIKISFAAISSFWKQYSKLENELSIIHVVLISSKEIFFLEYNNKFSTNIDRDFGKDSKGMLYHYPNLLFI